MPILTLHRLRNAVTTLFSIGFILLLLTGCNSSPWAVPDEAFDVEVPEPLNLSELIATLPSDTLKAHAIWTANTGQFGALYTEEILRIGENDQTQIVAELNAFATHPEITSIQQAIDSTSGEEDVLKNIELELTRGIQRFHYFFPSEPAPRIVWMNTGFNFAVYPTNEELGIGLEWFLGADHPMVQTLPLHLFPQYMRNRMEPELIPTTALRGWLLVHFSDPWYVSVENMVDEMMYWGKITFILHQCFPEVPVERLFDWTPESLEWAKNNERAVWIELQSQQDLFNTNRSEFGPLFSEGPFTNYGAIPQDSPDRLGIYMGWRMVNEYMLKNPELTFGELLATDDYQTIMKAYRP